MTNRENAYKQAFDLKKASLKRKEAEYDNKIAELYANNTRYAAICANLSSLGAKIAITALSGDTETLAKLSEEISKLQLERDEIVKSEGIKPVSYDCVLCRDTGYVGGKVCDCVKQIAKGFSLGLLSASLPLENSRFEDFNLEYYPTAASGTSSRKRMTGIFKLCREYAINFDPRTSENLLFMGGVGLGKTHLSLSIVNELLKKDFDVLYSSAYNLFSKMENEHFNLRTDDTYNYAINCDLLVIDDLGGEFVSPYVQTLLYNIVNTRLLASKPVIISTNLTMKEIESKYTPRVSSRLLGHYTAKLFIGDDIRQIKTLQK
ncbi:MAG: ATP-binding protein [Clostridia bacterium]|nr:ATP-binding protein [Clostridia bacterium]MBP3706706.1 ATP-binding protein [Clostridia bacterium]